MKIIPYRIILACAFIAAVLSSCSTPEQNTRLSAIVDLALNVAVRKGAITEADAKDVRDAKTIVLETEPAVTTPSVK